MGLITYPCSVSTCTGVTQDSSLPPPLACRCGKPLAYGSTAYCSDSSDSSESEDSGLFPSSSSSEEDDSGDEWEPPKADGSPRPSWFSGRRQEIRDRQTSPGGTLYCAICNLPIVVNAAGKEEWVSKSGKRKATSPHLDHYRSPTRGGDGDWIERKTKLRKDGKHMALSSPERARVEREVFNASPLRTSHMTCNCARTKQKRGY